MDHNVYQLAQQDDSTDYLDWADIRSAADFDIDAGRPALVKGLLLEKQVSLLCSPANTGKTSVAASIAAHIAQGKDLGSRRVRKGGVFYIAAEDATGVLERAYPFIKGSTAQTDDFLVSGSPVDLRDDAAIGGLIRGLHRWKERAKHERILVVFDTLNLSVGDGDENSARDMSRAMGNAQRIAAETSAHVMIVAHVPKADSSRPRGSTALEGNCDTVLVLRRVEDEDGDMNIVQAVPTKQRSIPRKTTFAFEIASHPVCKDEDGDQVTVAKAVPLDREIEILVSTKGDKPVKMKRNLKMERASAVLKVLDEIIRDKKLSSVPKQDIKDRCKAQSPDAFDAVLHNHESFDKGIRDALSTLVIQGKIKKIGQDHYVRLDDAKSTLTPQEEEDVDLIEKDDDA